MRQVEWGAERQPVKFLRMRKEAHLALRYGSKGAAKRRGDRSYITARNEFQPCPAVFDMPWRSAAFTKAGPRSSGALMRRSRCGIGDLDAVLLELVPDLEQERAAQIAKAVLRVVDPDPHFQIDGAVAEPLDQNIALGILQNAVDLVGGLEAERDGLARIGIVGDADGHLACARRWSCRTS